jgi:hypothetical protein
VEEVEQLTLGMLLEKAQVAGGAVSDPQVARFGIVLFGPVNLACHVLVEFVLAVLGGGGEVDSVRSLALWIEQNDGVRRDAG